MLPENLLGKYELMRWLCTACTHCHMAAMVLICKSPRVRLTLALWPVFYALWFSLPVLLFRFTMCLNVLCSKEKINLFVCCFFTGYQNGQNSHHQNSASGATWAWWPAINGWLLSHGQLHRFNRQKVHEEWGAVHYTTSIIHVKQILQQLQRFVPWQSWESVSPLYWSWWLWRSIW